MLSEHDYYVPLEHLFYVDSFLSIKGLIPAHDVITDALILHSDMKYKVTQKQEILNIMKHSIGRGYALLLNSIMYHRNKVDLTMEELEPYVETGLAQKIDGAYITRWMSLLSGERGQNAGFEFAKKAILLCGARHRNLLSKYISWLPFKEQASFAKQMVKEGIRDAVFLMKCLDVLPEGKRAPFAKQMYEEEGIKHPHFLVKYLDIMPEGKRAPFAKQMHEEDGIKNPVFLMKYLDIMPEEKRAPFAKQMYEEEGIKDSAFLMKYLDVMPEEEQEDLAWKWLQNPIKSISFMGKCLLAVQNRDPNTLREIALKNFEIAIGPYSIPFWRASLSLFEGFKEFKVVLLSAEKFPATKNNISLSTHLVPLYSRIGCTNRKMSYWHRRNLEDHIDDHPMNRFNLALAYFYERKDEQAQNEFRLFQTGQDTIAFLSQLHLAWIAELRGEFDSREIVELETCLKSGRLRGNPFISTNQLLARVYAQKGKFKESEEIMNQLQYNYKTEALHYYTLGVIEELKTNISNAQSYYQKFLSIPNGRFYLNGLYISSLLNKTLNNLGISYPYRLDI